MNAAATFQAVRHNEYHKEVKRTRKPNKHTRELWQGIASVFDDEAFKLESLTTRQVYYQCVTRGIVTENNQQQYDRVQQALVQMRRQDEIPWHRVRDGHRERTSWRVYNGIQEALEETAELYRRNLMRTQMRHVELWVEKDSLAGWLQPVAYKYGIPYAALKGFSSDGFQYTAAMEWQKLNKPVAIVYAGDFDPSGRDIAERLESELRYFYADVDVYHIGLHTEQVHALHLPTSFEAKKSDTRAKRFAQEYGSYCVELDAVPPNILRGWYEEALNRLLDTEQIRFQQQIEEMERQQAHDMVQRGLPLALA